MKKAKFAVVLMLIMLGFSPKAQAEEVIEEDTLNPFTEQGRENLWNKAKYNVS